MARNWFIIIGCLCCLYTLSSCQQEPVKPIKIDDFPHVEITSSRPYSKITRTDKHCLISIADSANVLLQSQGEIHIRGNSTANCPKRSFLLKLNEDLSIYGMPAAQSWGLLANYYDKTMLRNSLAFRLSEDSRLKWTPRAQFVELWFNNEHKGTYQWCEKIQVHPNRVNIPSDGWLVEVDARTPQDEPQFRTLWIEQPFHVLYPEHVDSTKLNAIASYFLEAENALIGESFADSIEGWRNYFDEQSWIDWYIINEIAKNTDAIFFSSCFMYTGQDGRIVIGPVWDYDIAFGNTTFNDTDTPEGWFIRTTGWYQRLFEDPTFAQEAKARFDYFYTRREDYFQFIRSQASILLPHVQANEAIWHTMNQQLWKEPFYSTYDENIDALIDWLSQRFEWMKTNW